jgi:hypothetical protein
VQFVTRIAGKFFFSQGVGDDAHHPTTRSLRGLRHDAHQTIVATTIHKLSLVLANPGAHLHSGSSVFGQGAWA